MNRKKHAEFQRTVARLFEDARERVELNKARCTNGKRYRVCPWPVPGNTFVATYSGGQFVREGYENASEQHWPPGFVTVLEGPL